jgi:membrane protease YdiL (CAAX protease family)
VKTARLVALVVGLLALTTVASPLVASVLETAGFRFTFSRVYNRVFEVALVVALAIGWRWLDLGSPREWGFRSVAWRRQLVTGLAIGGAGLAVGLALAWLGGGVGADLRYDPAKTVRKALLGVVAALVVGVGEETLFRGILLRRFALDLGPRRGVLVTTLVYAIVHALRGGGKIAATGALAGWTRTASLFAPLGDPVVWPGVAGLFLLGLVLAWVRGRTGSLWPSIGIHAAWVGVFRVGRLFFDIRQRPAWLVGPGWPPLVGGAAGMIAVLVTGMAVAVWLRRGRYGNFVLEERNFRMV